MSEFDDDEFDDDAFIQAATQVEQRLAFQDEFEDSHRPSKRRRLIEIPGNATSNVNNIGTTSISRVLSAAGPSEDQILSEDFESHVGGPRQPRVQSDPYDFDALTDDIPSDLFRTSPRQEENPVSNGPNGQKTTLRAPLQGLRQTTLFSREGVPNDSNATTKRRNWPMADRTEPPTHHTLDLEAAKTWVYPTNLGKTRDYQFNIVKRGLFHNTLVALPTGLGKTFIAATIMLNWYRWTKDSQIIFVAPTKPLVAQQIDACFNIVGIPYSQTCVLTGEISPAVREEQWDQKRVFFMTPQTLQSDLSKGIADPKKIVLLVVDEAHRAKGNYSYVEVVKFIRRFNESFRVLALTATPGGDVPSVQEVIDGLDISRVEIRTDQSLDIREYVHDRQVEKESFSNSDEMEVLMELYAKAVKPLLKEVAGINPTWSGDPISLTPYGCTKTLQTWMASAGRNAHFGLKGKVMAVFTTLAAIAHGMNLLKYHGISAAYHSWLDFKRKTEGDGKQKKSKWKEKLLKDESWGRMMDHLEQWTRAPDFIGHPKLAYLRQVVMNHLLDTEQANERNVGSATDTRIMVFSSFRDSAEEISNCLGRTSPLIKPHVFVGQATSKNSKGMSQKVQLETIEKFKTGVFNVLIATSIGEEGLDIGEVDLIVCYDSKASPLRMLQRMGRTGRKRAGRVVLLQMQGKEENDWMKAKDSYQHMQKEIAAGDKFTFHEDRSRRILPREVDPVLDKREVEIPVENTQHTPGELPTLNRRRKTKTKKKFHMPDGVETGFVTANALSGGLGRKKSNNSVTSRNSTKTAPPILVDEAEPMPYLDSVLMNDEEGRDFAQRYQNTVTNDVEVSAPALNKNPVYQRKLGKTKFVGHSRATQAFVRCMQQVADMSKQSSTGVGRPQADGIDSSRDMFSVIVSDDEIDSLVPAENTSLNNARSRGRPRKSEHTKKNGFKPRNTGRVLQRVSSAMEADASSPPPSDPAFAIRSQGIDLGSRDTPPRSDAALVDHDELSDLDGFIVDDDEVVEADDSDSDDERPSIPWLEKERNCTSSSRKRILSNLFDDELVADEEHSVNEASDDSLPDLDALLAKGRPGATKSKGQRGRRKRKVVDEDDDDDDG